jgi:predicted permease
MHISAKERDLRFPDVIGMGARKWMNSIGKVVGNPVIVSALVGIIFSVAAIPIPVVVDRTLKILAGMALPMALLVIGAALSFEQIWQRIVPVCMTGVFKLMVLPGIGYILYSSFNISVRDYLPGLILLASPTATVAYVMAKEMKGDADFAAAAISLSTLASAVTFILWLNLAS